MDPGLRKETIMALCNLLRWFPSAMHSQMMAVVSPVWSCLASNTELYPIPSFLKTYPPLGSGGATFRKQFWESKGGGRGVVEPVMVSYL